MQPGPTQTLPEMRCHARRRRRMRISVALLALLLPAASWAVAGQKEPDLGGSTRRIADPPRWTQAREKKPDAQASERELEVADSARNKATITPTPALPETLSRPWVARALQQILDPWFFFGMTAQFVFFMRFVVQWIASEKKKRSTVPIAFWYLSLLGSLALFIYAFHRWDFVIMAGQLLACVIYVRNLMLISDWRKRRQQAGLPLDPQEADDWEEAAASGGKSHGGR
jgi:lipid-A-disaccharide synthase-like uncharacterized protein